MPEGRIRSKNGRFVRKKVGDSASSKRTEVSVQTKPETGKIKQRLVVEKPDCPLKPAQCRAWLRKTVAAAFPEVVEGFLNEAAKGGCAHLKMAADTVASKAPVKENKPMSKGSAARLLEELDRELGLD